MFGRRNEVRHLQPDRAVQDQLGARGRVARGLHRGQHRGDVGDDPLPRGTQAVSARGHPHLQSYRVLCVCFLQQVDLICVLLAQ